MLGGMAFSAGAGTGTGAGAGAGKGKEAILSKSNVAKITLEK